MFRTTPKFVEHLRNEGFDVWTISLWEKWLAKTSEFDSVIAEIEAVFMGTTLGGGMGLSEANSRGFYGDRQEQEACRQLDEKKNWRNIETVTLNANYTAPTYLDAKGFYFHLPAFLIADLNGDFGFAFVDTLIEKNPSSIEWIGLLDTPQKNAIIKTLELLKHFPDYHCRLDAIELAIKRIQGQQKTAG